MSLTEFDPEIKKPNKMIQKRFRVKNRNANGKNLHTKINTFTTVYIF